MRCLFLLFLCAAAQAAIAQAPPDEGCGEVVTIPTHSGTTTRYAFAPAKDAKIGEVLVKTKGTRQQAATVTGGPIAPGRALAVAACEPREPHDFVDQQDEVAAGIVRFMRGGNY